MLMEIQVYKCDICARQKGSTNHWWRVRAGNAFHIYHWTYFGEGGEDSSVPTKHICSQECLLRLLQLFLSLPFGSGSTIIPSTEVKIDENPFADAGKAPVYPDNACDPLADAGYDDGVR